MKQKAQIQLGESIFVVMIIILLLVFGIVFYSQAEKESIGSSKTIFKDLETITLTQFASSLTELQCSIQQVEFPNCFDKTKLTAFISLVQSEGDDVAKEFYFSQLGNSNITISEIYPVSNPVLKWNIYQNLPSEKSVSATGLLVSRVDLPVSLLNPISNTYSFGILTIEKYN